MDSIWTIGPVPEWLLHLLPPYAASPPLSILSQPPHRLWLTGAPGRGWAAGIISQTRCCILAERYVWGTMR